MPANTVTVAQIIHPRTGKPIAFEIVDNMGRTFFVAEPGDIITGMRAEGFPSIFVEGKGYVRCERVEIARLEGK